MAYPLYDRVRETSTAIASAGAGTVTLAGAMTGFQSFAVVGDTQVCTYLIEATDGNGNLSGPWELTQGIYTLSGTSLSRGLLLKSSTNSRVGFTGGHYRLSLVANATVLQPPTWALSGDFGANNALGADATAALQTALTTIAAAGGGRLLLDGQFQLSGALQDGGDGNAQILVPPRPVANTDKQVSIEIVGRVALPTSGLGLYDSQYSVLQSTLTGKSGTAAVMASSTSGGVPNNCGIYLSNVHLQLPTDPSISGFNFTSLRDCAFDNVWVNTPDMIPFGSQAAVTHSNNYGVQLPANNYPCFIPVRNLRVWNMYHGVLVGELGVFDSVSAVFCKVGYEFGPAYHPNVFTFLQSLECITHLSIPNAGGLTRIFRIAVMDIENSNNVFPIWNTINHLDDPGNLGHAVINYRAVDAGVGGSSTFTKNGGTHVTTVDMSA